MSFCLYPYFQLSRLESGSGLSLPPSPIVTSLSVAFELPKGKVVTTERNKWGHKMKFTIKLKSQRLVLFVMSTWCAIFSSLILIFKSNIFAIILNSVSMHHYSATMIELDAWLTFQQLTIKEGTAAFNAWVETPIPVYTKFYFFDMLNPRDLFHNHEKPILVEKGPYVFRWV